MNAKKYVVATLLLVTFIPLYSAGKGVDVDISACKMILDLFKDMKSGTPQAQIETKLDAILATRPYKTMFKHYNRDWRPNHLPPDVFKRMVMSLRFPQLYKKGENQRADQMWPNWQKYYNDIPLFERNVEYLRTIDIHKLIREAVAFAQSWLPEEMKVPDFYLVVHPNGGSGAFALPGVQGYDFFQLQRNEEGNIHLQYFTDVIAHESHHLGLEVPDPGIKNPKHQLAFRFLEYFIGEGTATKFIDNLSGGVVPRIDPKRTPNFDREGLIAKPWQEYTRNHNRIWLKFFVTFEHAFTGEINEEQMNKEFREYWITGMIGRNYFLGSEIFGAIYLGLGKEACFQAIRDPRQMLPLYNKALDKAPQILGKCVRVPDSIIAKSLSLGKE